MISISFCFLLQVESLIHRIESVTLVADRRDGLRALKDLAKVKGKRSYFC